MIRSQPLRRRKRLNPRGKIARKTPRRVARMTDDDRDYRDWVHQQQCVGHVLVRAHACSGPIEQSHERNMTGLGLKAPERRSIAMCRQLHQQWEQHRGVFARWTKEARRMWFGALVDEANLAFDKHAEAA